MMHMYSIAYNNHISIPHCKIQVIHNNGWYTFVCLITSIRIVQYLKCFNIYHCREHQSVALKDLSLSIWFAVVCLSMLKGLDICIQRPKQRSFDLNGKTHIAPFSSSLAIQPLYRGKSICLFDSKIHNISWILRHKHRCDMASGQNLANTLCIMSSTCQAYR